MTPHATMPAATCCQQFQRLVAAGALERSGSSFLAVPVVLRFCPLCGRAMPGVAANEVEEPVR